MWKSFAWNERYGYPPMRFLPGQSFITAGRFSCFTAHRRNDGRQEGDRRHHGTVFNKLGISNEDLTFELNRTAH